MIIPAHMSVGRWLPVAAAYPVMQIGASADPSGQLLSTIQSGLLLGAYSATVIALACWLTPKRDIQ